MGSQDTFDSEKYTLFFIRSTVIRNIDLFCPKPYEASRATLSNLRNIFNINFEKMHRNVPFYVFYPD